MQESEFNCNKYENYMPSWWEVSVNIEEINPL
jgi:hypothetical protein